MTRFSPALLGDSPTLSVENRLLANTTVTNTALFANLNLNLNEQNVSNGSPLRVSSSSSDIAVNTQWLDVHDYSNLIITMEGKKNNYYWLIWANINEPLSINYAIAIDEYICLTNDLNPSTRSYSIKSRWLCILTSMTDDNKLQLETLNYVNCSSLSFVFKHRPTDVQIGTNNLSTSVNLNGNYNALYTMLTDDTGKSLATATQAGSVLYTSLSDSTGNTLLVENNNLSVALKDVSGNTIGSTHTASNSLFVCLTDNSGTPQASYNASADLSLNGVVLFYSLQDNSGNNIGSSTSDISNALYVTLYNDDNAITDSIHVKTRNEDVTRKIAINDNLKLAGSELITSDNIHILLHSLNIYNNNNVDVWVKIYDVYNSAIESITSVEDLHLLDSYLKFNIPILKDGFRDLTFDKALVINYGLYARASTLHYSDITYENIIDNVYINGTYSSSAKNNFVSPISRDAPVNSSLISKTTINQFDISGIKGWTKISHETIDHSANISYVISEVSRDLSANVNVNVDVSFTTYNVSDNEYNVNYISSSGTLINYPAIPTAIWEGPLTSNALQSGKIYRTDVSLHNAINESFSIWGSVKNNTSYGRGGYFNMGSSGGAIIYETQTSVSGPIAPISEDTKTDSTIITCAHRRPYNTFDLSSYITQIDYYSYELSGTAISPWPVVYAYDNSCTSIIKTDFSANTYSINVQANQLNARIVLIRSNDSSLADVSGVAIADISLSNLTNSSSSSRLNLTYKSDISQYFGVVPDLSNNVSVKYFSGPHLRGYVYSDTSLTCCSFSYNSMAASGVIMKVIDLNGAVETVSGYIYNRYDASLIPAYIKLELTDISLYYTNQGRETITSNPGQSRLIYLGEGIIPTVLPVPVVIPGGTGGGTGVLPVVLPVV